MPLKDLSIRTAKSQEKPYKLADEKGLFLWVKPNGAKFWRFKYRFLGKEKLLTLTHFIQVDTMLVWPGRGHASASKACTRVLPLNASSILYFM